jgi:hypothetical protein
MCFNTILNGQNKKGKIKYQGFPITPTEECEDILIRVKFGKIKNKTALNEIFQNTFNI